MCSDVLHPNRANVSKDELRGKLGELYKAKKEDVSVFGFKTHFGGGKSTGFALIYDSAEAMKKFEPRYRLVRYGMATKVEKASRQQRTFPPLVLYLLVDLLVVDHSNGLYTWFKSREIYEKKGRGKRTCILTRANRQATQEQDEGIPRHSQGQGWCEEGEEISGCTLMMATKVMAGVEWRFPWDYCSDCFFIMVD